MPRSRGCWRRSTRWGCVATRLIVYLSDHGESLGEHGEPTHGIFLYGATLDVPLIIAPPPGATLGSPRSAAGRPARAAVSPASWTSHRRCSTWWACPCRLDSTA